MQEVATYLKEDADGVPFIVIGDDVYAGYISSYDNDIKNSIQELYDTKKEDRYDVFKEIEKNPNGNNNEKKEEKKSEFKLTTESCFLIHCVLLVALFIIFLVYDNYKTAKLIEVIKKGK